jgi:hypothetical protein
MLLVDPRNIIIDDGYNVRTDMGEMDELRDSIIENGIQTPLKCYKEKGVEKYPITRSLWSINMTNT